MTAFFDDMEEDKVGSWSAGDPDAWKNAYGGIADLVNDAIILNNTALKGKEADTEFAINGNKGYGILQSDILEVCGLIDFIRGHIQHRPYFAHKELNNLSEKVGLIEDSKYCRFASDQNDTLAELAYLRADIRTLKEEAYEMLEWEV